jgi:hypothetical protein
MKKISLVLILIYFIALPAVSQTTDFNPRYGVYGLIGINMHTADFGRIPECPSCNPGYESGFGIGPSFGLLYELPLFSKSLLSLQSGIQ